MLLFTQILLKDRGLIGEANPILSIENIFIVIMHWPMIGNLT